MAARRVSTRRDRLDPSGRCDVIFQNSTTGTNYYANMAGGRFSGCDVVVPNFTPDYAVTGAGDLHRDGHMDVIFQSQSTGTTVYAHMTGGTFYGFGLVTGPIVGWKVV